MKQTMILQNDERMLLNVAQTVRKPFVWLANYYSKILGKEIHIKETLLLLNVQCAFLFTVFPINCSLFLRAPCLYWFCHALMTCKKAVIAAK